MDDQTQDREAGGSSWTRHVFAEGPPRCEKANVFGSVYADLVRVDFEHSVFGQIYLCTTF